jgi:sRNA-binding carbon storage regulator CsrA
VQSLSHEGAVLSIKRRKKEKLVLLDPEGRITEITIGNDSRPGEVQLVIEAPEGYQVLREELCRKMAKGE